MTPQEAQEILNSNSNGKVYTPEEAKACLELCTILIDITDQNSLKSKQGLTRRQAPKDKLQK